MANHLNTFNMSQLTNSPFFPHHEKTKQLKSVTISYLALSAKHHQLHDQHAPQL